jgi:tRNA A37 methylthiotransferase MiaB
LRTTVIVGFPGETDTDFSELESFVADTRFDHLGVFTYSHEEGTSASALPDDVPAPMKRRRQSQLMNAQKRRVTRVQGAQVGQHVRLLVDRPRTSRAELMATGWSQARTSIRSPTAISRGSFQAHSWKPKSSGAGTDLIARPRVDRLALGRRAARSRRLPAAGVTPAASAPRAGPSHGV